MSPVYKSLRHKWFTVSSRLVTAIFLCYRSPQSLFILLRSGARLASQFALVPAPRCPSPTSTPQPVEFRFRRFSPPRPPLPRVFLRRPPNPPTASTLIFAFRRVEAGVAAVPGGPGPITGLDTSLFPPAFPLRSPSYFCRARHSIVFRQPRPLPPRPPCVAPSRLVSLFPLFTLRVCPPHPFYVFSASIPVTVCPAFCPRPP